MLSVIYSVLRACRGKDYIEIIISAVLEVGDGTNKKNVGDKLNGKKIDQSRPQINLPRDLLVRRPLIYP